MSSIARYRETLRRWGLSDVPFRATPPEDPVELSRIFYGRWRELHLALPALYEGRNVLVRGLWGVGKTAFILRLLHRLQQETAALGEQMLILYVGRFPGETSEALYRAVLLSLSERLAATEPEARRVWNTLSGLQITHSRQLQVEGKVDLQLVSIGGSWERGKEEGWQIQNVYTVLLRLLDVAQEQYGRVIVAVDDLDKKEPRAMQDLVDDATDLLRRGQGKRGFLLTGRFTSTLQDISGQMLGLFSETITLPRMSTDELYHIAVNYLNTARERPSGEVTPFTPQVVSQIAEYAYHIPRQFNLICEKVMRRGAMNGVERIDDQTFPTLWRMVQDEFALELTPDIRRLLYIARRSGGLSADIDDATLEQLGVETFVELLPTLRALEGDLLIRQEDGRLLPSAMLPDEEEHDD
ncbi:MAG: AAA+ family ATPase [Chloroflexi bacterium]|nr:MAG: AAA+ family ATPase [Chloroflexota bacterium]